MGKFEGEKYWLTKLKDYESEELISVCGYNSIDVHYETFKDYVIPKINGTDRNKLSDDFIIRWTDIIGRVEDYSNKNYVEIIEHKIKSASFDNSVDYKPMDDTLEPNKYFETGYYRGQKDLIKLILDSGLISDEKLNELL